MASDLSLYLGNKIVRWLGGEDMPAAPASIYIALFDGDPKGAGTEVTEDVITSGRIAGVWDVPAAGTDNQLIISADVDFGESESIVDVTHVAVFDAATSGNLLASKVLNAPISAVIGTEIKFVVPDLKFTIGT